ncbi:hypothetical protein ACWED2_05965 [Amycolatopsis sp. NPDC005003]
MNMRERTGFGLALLALGGGLAVAGAGPASAAPSGTQLKLSCSLAWHDANTAGVRCTGAAFFGFAKCKNGRIAQGAVAASGTISYAYCTSLNSSLATPLKWGGAVA